MTYRTLNLTLSVIACSLLLSACLTPEERAEVYGGGKDKQIAAAKPDPWSKPAPQTNSAPTATSSVPARNGDNSSIVYRPAPANRTASGRKLERTTPGLRSSADASGVTYQRPAAKPKPTVQLQAGEYAANPNSCGAQELTHLQGQPLASLNSMRFQQPIRIVMPGQMLTKDYIANRLNIDISKQSVIVRLWCG